MLITSNISDVKIFLIITTFNSGLYCEHLCVSVSSEASVYLSFSDEESVLILMVTMHLLWYLVFLLLYIERCMTLFAVTLSPLHCECNFIALLVLRVLDKICIVQSLSGHLEQSYLFPDHLASVIPDKSWVSVNPLSLVPYNTR